jgi:DNA-binding CsgD family transcriptional regulator
VTATWRTTVRCLIRASWGFDVSDHAACDSTSTAAEVDQITDVEALIRRLVTVVSRNPASRPNGAPHVLLDLEIDGVRCRLETTKPASTMGSLSPREAEVARMVAQGYPNKTIASVLEISSFTVSSYLRRIFAKLGVNSRAAMVASVIENHLLPQSNTGQPPRKSEPPYTGPQRQPILLHR